MPESLFVGELESEEVLLSSLLAQPFKNRDADINKTKMSLRVSENFILFLKFEFYKCSQK